jgi:predicted oxidoreductase
VQKHQDRCVGPCDSVESLAQAMDVDESTLSSTLTAYNAAAQTGKDTGFGKDSFLKPLAAPFYAIKQYACRFRTIGGLKTNANAQLLDTNGDVIQNIFCCGSVAAGRSEGLADNAGYGLLAGAAIVDELKADAS